MKLISILLYIYILTTIIPNSSLFTPNFGCIANATNTTPHIICPSDVWLYTDGGEKLFKIPSSYYARINNLDDNFYYVTFNGVAGRLKKGEVSAVGYHTTAKGTIMELKIHQNYCDFSAIQLKKHPDAGAESVTQIPTSEIFSYIGSYPTDDGSVWYYVRYKESYGYILSTRTTEPEIKHPIFEPEIPTDSEASAEPTDTESKDIIDNLDSTELKIIIIIGLAVPALAIVILLFKPFRKKYE